MTEYIVLNFVQYFVKLGISNLVSSPLMTDYNIILVYMRAY